MGEASNPVYEFERKKISYGETFQQSLPEVASNGKNASDSDAGRAGKRSLAELCHRHQKDGGGKATSRLAQTFWASSNCLFKDKEGHWKHGGIVGVLGYGGGVIGRYSDVPDLFPGVEHFHTLRVNQPASKFYKTERLREIIDIWERRGSGMMNMHGSTGDMVLLGAFTEELEPIFAELTAKGWDLGGSGSALRTPSCCVGKARCEFVLHRHPGHLLQPDPGIPGRDAPSGLALQVQIQG